MALVAIPSRSCVDTPTDALNELMESPSSDALSWARVWSSEAASDVERGPPACMAQRDCGLLHTEIDSL